MIAVLSRSAVRSDGPLAGAEDGKPSLLGPLGREHEAGARERADADVLGLEAREVAEGERAVVALRLRGREPGEHRVADFERVGEVFEGRL